MTNDDTSDNLRYLIRRAARSASKRADRTRAQLEKSDHGKADQQVAGDRRRGARLVLTFNASRNAFIGTVENTTEEMLCAVRVEVHLDDGTELGPSARNDVQSSGTIEVELPTEGQGFETWTAHPELSPCESLCWRP